MSELKKKGLVSLSDDDLESVAGGFGEGGVVNWTVAADMAGQHELQAVVGTSSSNLSCSSFGNGVTLNVGGMVYTAANNAIDYHGGGVVYNTLASFVVPNVYGTVQVTATWRFNGTYAGSYLGEITASGVVTA